jgi:hypothetical protein
MMDALRFARLRSFGRAVAARYGKGAASNRVLKVVDERD